MPFDWTEDNLRAQYNVARQNGWIDVITAAAQAAGQPAALLLGMASRETGFLWPRHPDGAILGDGGHGHGLMQIDDRSFPEFCQSAAWRDIAKNVAKGIEVLQGKAAFLRHHGIDEALVPRAAVAAYNCGEGNVLKALHAGQDVDVHTAHGTYAADVLARAAIFEGLLAEHA